MAHPGKLEQKANNQLKTFLAECEIQKPQGKKILEIGFKNGLFLDQCHKAAIEPCGIEINSQYYEAVKSNYPDLNVLWYDGGVFPVPDQSFDFVVSYQVLEHVSSIEHIFSECIRVLKPNGIMYHVCPNYHSFYEGHYKVIWIPFFTKSIGRLYLKLLRRDTANYEGFNLIKPKIVARTIKHFQNEITVVSLGKAEFVKNFNPEQIDKVDQAFLKKILKLLNKVKIIKKLLLYIICTANIYYPLVLILKKVENKEPQCL